MENTPGEIMLPTLSSIRKLLEPINNRLEQINVRLQQQNMQPKAKVKEYYRNEDLKKLFGLSNNTIIKYRETGVLPWTKMGDIYLYEVDAINKILEKNKG